MTNAELHGCAFPGWQCFHCGEIFETVGGARDHFGAKQDAVPGCMIKVQLGAERGLLMKLREVEEELAKAQQQLLEECSEAAKIVQAQASRHSKQLCDTEELGYSRGLKAYTELEAEKANLTSRVHALETIGAAVIRDLRMRGERDSDGCVVVNLSHSIWIRLCDLIEGPEHG